MQEVVKKEVLKLLQAGMIYPISDSEWVSPIHIVPKKGGYTVVENEEGKLLTTRPVTGWRMVNDFRKLNKATRKDHFPLPFMDQMLERLAGQEFYCYLDGYSGFLQIPIHPTDQEKTTFTCPYGTFAYKSLPFGLGVLLAHRNARRRRTREEMHRLPGVRQQAARTGISTEDHTTRMALRSMGARHGGSIQEVFSGRTHSSPGRSRQVHEVDRSSAHHKFDCFLGS